MSDEAQSTTPSPFPAIADLAFLSDCHTAALLAPDGGVAWLCPPRFDAPSVFATLLDRRAGYFRFGPFGVNTPSSRVYVPGTNVLVTTWQTPTGWLEVRDALTILPAAGPDTTTPHERAPADADAAHRLVRTASCLDGHVELELVCEPVFDTGRVAAEWSASDEHTATASGAGARLRLRSDLALGVQGGHARARHVLREGEWAYCSLSWDEELGGPSTHLEAVAEIHATVDYWRNWLDDAAIPDHPWRAALERSALTIKGLTYTPTGATIAAPTTSLPETPGGERNWDYRYNWIRDSSFTVQALHYLALDGEADEFVEFLAGLETNDEGSLQVLYGIDGRRDLAETTLGHLSGYGGARPVRVGNGAATQQQNDLYGAVLDAILMHARRSRRVPRTLWPLISSQAERAASVWRRPDQGIWEARGAPQHYVSSKIMCWVALDRAAKLAELLADADATARWRSIADEISADILQHGLSERGVLRQHYGTDALDASSLLAVLYGFLPHDDERLHATVHAVADELTDDGFVLRYCTDETDDGLTGREGSFLICSFWLVAALTAIGELDPARALMEKLLRIASPLGLLAEEFEPLTGQHLGNFPQAFSHLALIEAARRLIAAERRGEFD